MGEVAGETPAAAYLDIELLQALWVSNQQGIWGSQKKLISMGLLLLIMVYMNIYMRVIYQKYPKVIYWYYGLRWSMGQKEAFMVIDK